MDAIFEGTATLDWFEEYGEVDSRGRLKEWVRVEAHGYSFAFGTKHQKWGFCQEYRLCSHSQGFEEG